MEIHHLRTFSEVARVLSFTQAARNLHCAQPTVTGQIKGLEKKLGVLLFHRRGRCPIELTPAGVLLQERAALILDSISCASRDVRQAAIPRSQAWIGGMSPPRQGSGPDGVAVPALRPNTDLTSRGTTAPRNMPDHQR